MTSVTNPPLAVDSGQMKRIPTLDGWRAVAISAVVLCHLGECLYQTQAAYEMSIWRDRKSVV